VPKVHKVKARKDYPQFGIKKGNLIIKPGKKIKKRPNQNLFNLQLRNSKEQILEYKEEPYD